MTKPLVHIVNEEFMKRKYNLLVVSFDLDGSLTDLHIPRVYNLFWNTLLKFLPNDMNRQLRKYDFDELQDRVGFPLGWFLDLENGYLVHAYSDGRIIQVRKGNQVIEPENISEIYAGRTIDFQMPLNSNQNRDKFLMICDGFDVIEAIVYSALSQIGNYPKKRRIETIDYAMKQTHNDDENGFKSVMMRNPEEYGISPNRNVIDFLDSLNEWGYITALMTNSPNDYTKRILEVLGLDKKFDIVIPNAGKPALFYENTQQYSDMWNQLKRVARESKKPHRVTLESPQQIVCVGDHLIKDIKYAHQSGMFTVLRLPDITIREIKKKMRKYAGIEFRKDNSLSIRDTEPQQKDLSELNTFLAYLYDCVDVLVTKVPNLRPLFLSTNLHKLYHPH